MNTSHYHVVFTGKTVEGHTVDDVKNKVSLLFRIGEEKIERLFSGKPVLLRKNVDYKTALRYQNVLQKAGAVCRIIEMKNEVSQKVLLHEDMIPPSFQEDAKPRPPLEILKWNWGAFLLNWIWGLGNKVYISLLCFIPFIGLIMPIVLGWKGNEWAWKNKQWKSVEHFKEVQKKWTIWGIAISIIFTVIFTVISIFSISQIASRFSTYQKLLTSGEYTTSNVCTQNRMQIQTAMKRAYNDNTIRGSGRYPSTIDSLVILGYLEAVPECPSNGKYLANGENVFCTVHGLLIHPSNESSK